VLIDSSNFLVGGCWLKFPPGGYRQSEVAGGGGGEVAVKLRRGDLLVSIIKLCGNRRRESD